MIAAAKAPEMNDAVRAALTAYNMQMGLPDGTHALSLKHRAGLQLLILTT